MGLHTRVPNIYILWTRWLKGNTTDLFINIFIFICIITQYSFLIACSIRIAPSDPPPDLVWDKWASPNCYLNHTLAFNLFDILGLVELNDVERLRLFHNLDYDGDGTLRFTELVRPHVFVPVIPQSVSNGAQLAEMGNYSNAVDYAYSSSTAKSISGPLGNDLMNPNNVSIWELMWVIEVYRRVKSYRVETWGPFYGNGLDGKVPVDIW